MGVSLERVQFKFASIIGELCSEPVILSQFAVWVDLKMAEYKAKGAMSLDCSGCKPKPTWMKGVIPPEKASIQEEDRLTDRRTGIGVSDESTGPSFSDYSERPPIHDRLSPELIIVKEEPRSPHETFHKDYYSDSTLKPSTSVSRKRYSEEASVEYHSSVKAKRTSFLPHNQSEQNSEANQSLLSVIGGGENANEEKVSLIDRSLPLTQSAGTFPSTSQHSQSMYNLADIKLGQEDSSNNDTCTRGYSVLGMTSESEPGTTKAESDVFWKSKDIGLQVPPDDQVPSLSDDTKNPVTYRYIVGGTQKGKGKVTDSTGHSYVLKSDKMSDAVRKYKKRGACYSCSQCSYRGDKQQTTAHCVMKHLPREEAPYICNHCGKVSVKITDMRKHFNKKHPGMDMLTGVGGTKYPYFLKPSDAHVMSKEQSLKVYMEFNITNTAQLHPSSAQW